MPEPVRLWNSSRMNITGVYAVKSSQPSSHYLSQCWPRSVSAYGVIRPQWIDSMNLIQSCFTGTVAIVYPSDSNMILVYMGNLNHYGDVIMGAITSQITNLTIVYLTVNSGADQRKHQSSASLAFVRGIHRGPVNSPHKWPVTRKMFPFDDVLMYNDDRITTKQS